MIARSLCLAVVGSFLAAPAALAQDEAPNKATVWDEETLELFGTLPVQEGGRVKPLHSLAGFQLLRLNGARTVRGKYTPDDRKRGQVAWLLDCLFFPHVAHQQRVFMVENDEVLTAIGVGEAIRRKRDRYSYDELRPGIHKLMQEARALSRRDDSTYSPVDRQLLDLARGVQEYTSLTHQLEFARVRYQANASEGLRLIYKGQAELPLSGVLAGARKVTFLFQQLQGLPAERRDPEIRAIQALANRIESTTRQAGHLALFPPSESTDDQPEWLSPADLANMSFTSQLALERQQQLLGRLEAMEAAKGDPAKFKAELKGLHEGLVALAKGRDQHASVALEYRFYQGDYFFKALILYMFGFIGCIVTWITVNRWPPRVAFGFLVLGTILVAVGITIRCVIKGRPPVSTLYETILFITGTGVALTLIVEAITRMKIALSVGAFLGALGMFLAAGYEARGEDTMGTLIAVLDTNFWLATHVTCITLGYKGGLVAGLLGHVYLLGKMVGIQRDDKSFYRFIGKLTYGVLCFGLIFSVVGTILGGIWANDSWGRFWGWDPKENGALMICLWQILILHARMGGYVRDWGVAALSVIGAGVVVFSWWGVNLLGVGLHSYGFTDGVVVVLYAYYGFEVLFLLAAGGHRLVTSGMASPTPDAPDDPPVLEDLGAVEPAAEVESVAETKAESAAETKAGPEAAAEAEPAAEAEAEPESAKEAEADAGAEPAADADADAPEESVADADGDASANQEPDSKD
jgi:ABC-type transport system involved in cytochrome c biogenesis permease subunit